MIGRLGKIFCNNAAKKGCAGAAMPLRDNNSPFPGRCTRDCTAGVFAMSANKLLVAETAAFCAKRRNSRSPMNFGQVGDFHGNGPNFTGVWPCRRTAAVLRLCFALQRLNLSKTNAALIFKEWLLSNRWSLFRPSILWQRERTGLQGGSPDLRQILATARLQPNARK